MIVRTLCAIVLIGVSALSGNMAEAHQQRAAFSEVLFNTRTGKIEIAHRFSLHDAEHAVRNELGFTGDIYNTQEVRDAFARYAAERFALASRTNAPLVLMLVGVEVREGYLWVYQETTDAHNLRPEQVSELTIRNDMLRDIWSDQLNTVNVIDGPIVRTLTFSGRDGAKTVVPAR